MAMKKVRRKEVSEEEKTEETSLMSLEKAEPLDFKMELPTSTPGI